MHFSNRKISFPKSTIRPTVKVRLFQFLFLAAFLVGIRPLDLRAETKISVLQFNVENLFDAIHDSRKDDYTYLPLSLKRDSRFLDSKEGAKFLQACVRSRFPKWRIACLQNNWSEKVLDQKLSNLAKVISSVNAGKGADIVFLQEVENLRVLKALAAKMPSSKYEPVLIEGDDPRGIDVAILTRFPILSSRLYRSPKVKKSKKRSNSRGILQVSLKGPNEQTIEVLGLHLPSQFNSVEKRQSALEQLNSISKDLKSDSIIIAAGDFNITAKEEQKLGLINDYAKSGNWRVAHLESCQNCKGTHYDSGSRSWSFLDQIWISKNIKGLKWNLAPTTVRVVDDVPEHFKFKKGLKMPRRMVIQGDKLTGTSDHWPLYLEIKKL